MNTCQKSNKTMKDLREKAGLTQRDVSIMLDIRQSTVSDWERGATNPRLTLPKIKQLINMYNCTFDELVDALETTTDSKRENKQHTVAA